MVELYQQVYCGQQKVTVEFHHRSANCWENNGSETCFDLQQKTAKHMWHGSQQTALLSETAQSARGFVWGSIPIVGIGACPLEAESFLHFTVTFCGIYLDP